MTPEIFTILKNNAAVVTLLGTNPFKVFPFDEAPEKTTYPYVTWTVFSGVPQNTLDKIPLLDILSTQVDVWGKDANEALDVAAAVRDALEPFAHMVGLGSTVRDPDTKAYRVRLDFDFFTER